MSSAHEISASNQSVTGPTLRWALKRTGVGLAILAVMVTAAACLLYAGIEPELADAAGTGSAQIANGALPHR
jgi:hypothetical protein